MNELIYHIILLWLKRFSCSDLSLSGSSSTSDLSIFSTVSSLSVSSWFISSSNSAITEPFSVFSVNGISLGLSSGEEPVWYRNDRALLYFYLMLRNLNMYWLGRQHVLTFVLVRYGNGGVFLCFDLHRRSFYFFFNCLCQRVRQLKKPDQLSWVVSNTMLSDEMIS